MNRRQPFTHADLVELGEFYASTDGVVSMREIHAGNRDRRVVGVRHDVDNHPKALDTAVAMARWEAENGWRSTYFLLHTAAYWHDGRWREAADEIAELGHEIGLHADAIADALVNGGDPAITVQKALYKLRAAGHTVTGVVGHGNRICHDANFANDEQFLECVRPKLGPPDRVLEHNGRKLRLNPRPLADFGLEYEAIGLRQYEKDGKMRTRPGQVYNTDSGGKWYYEFELTVAEFRRIVRGGQLHLLIHPDWWSQAFRRVEVTA